MRLSSALFHPPAPSASREVSASAEASGVGEEEGEEVAADLMARADGLGGRRAGAETVVSFGRARIC